MKDQDGITFLQWCLPRLRMRWPGFRKVRKQVYKRIDRRMKELAVPGPSEYRAYLERHPQEWRTLDTFCRISLSRFHRDRAVFQFLQREVLPKLATLVQDRHETDLRCWSIGCAAGEEPYTLALLWKLVVAAQFPAIRIRILATDSEAYALARARAALYPGSALRDLPEPFRFEAFEARGHTLRLKPEYREGVLFAADDIRQTGVRGAFHFILCRNLALTYFDEDLQRETLATIYNRLLPNAAVVIGSTEAMPSDSEVWETWSEQFRVYRRRDNHRLEFKV